MGKNPRLLTGLFVAAILVTVVFLLSRGGENEITGPSTADPLAPHAPPEEITGKVLLEEDSTLAGAPDESAEVARAAVEAPSQEPETTVTILVLLEQDHSPVSGVRAGVNLTEDVYLDDGRDSRVTDEEGMARYFLARGAIVNMVDVDAGPRTTGVFLNHNISIATGTDEVITVFVTSGATVSGTVVDTDGHPVPGAAVQGWCTYPWILDREPRADPDREVSADDAGRFSVPHLGRRFVLQAAAPGMACLRLFHGELSAGDDVEGLELVLGPAGSIDGRVLDPAGNPLAGVEIESARGWQYAGPYQTSHPAVFGADPSVVKAISAEDGSFSFTALAPWSYRFLVDHPGFARWSGRHAPADGFLEIRLEGGLELTGRILDARGRAVPGAEVRLHTRPQDPATTDEQGRFRLTGLEKDPFGILYVQAAGHAILVHQPLAIRSDVPNEIELRLEEEKVIAGRVVDVDGNGVADAPVEIEGDRVVDFGSLFMSLASTWERRHRVNETRTDADGSFRLDRLYDGSFKISAADPRDPGVQAVETVHSGVEDLVLILDPEAVFDVTLEGRVTDALTGRPVVSFEVQPWSMDAGSKFTPALSVTDEEGVYEIGGLVPASIRVWFDADGYTRTMIPAEDYGPGRHRLDAVLYPERKLHLRVIDRSGEPFAGVWTWFEDETGGTIYYDSVGGGWNWTHRLDARGEARLSGLRAALLTFVVGGTLGAEPARFDVDLRIQPEGVLELALDTERPAHLVLSLFGTTNAAEFGEVRVIDDPGTWSEKVEARDDLWPLDAPSFEISVRDAAGVVRARVSATTEDGREWMVSVKEGDTGFTSNARRPHVQFAVPHEEIDIEVVAEGYRTLRFHLHGHEITRPDEVATSRAVFVLRNP